MRKGLYRQAGVHWEEVGFAENFFNSMYNSIGPGRIASWQDLMGNFDEANATRQAGTAPSDPGISQFVGNVAGEALPYAAAITATLFPPTAPYGAISLGLLAAESGAREAGGARKIVNDYGEKDRGRSLCWRRGCFSCWIWGYSCLYGLRLAGGIAIKGAARHASPSILRALKGLTLNPTREMKELGEGMIAP